MVKIPYPELKKGATIIYEGKPHEIIESALMFQGRGQSNLRVRLKNLIEGNTISQTFHPSDSFEEADLEKKDIKFLYQTKGQYFFCEINDPSKRFSFAEAQIGTQTKYLKPNGIVTGIIFNEKIINFVLPIKMQLKIKESAPGIKGDRAQGGTKSAILESGAEIQVPLFIDEGDVIEVNTETGEYVKRV